ncbi:hypothetical protein DUNSADRAFT_1790 [Dunaliella salina]|uniref:Encoded protein n=1 Tax=Dunaliella salina TaxID=3046 RepID=A0ABQ7GWM0_DUNSA|nr:hypothetical protein DUNSADRAFT_1790 [Dunaliella salina]|eukprot:KAF5839013.1 hypothetical protein DUNSADRAFT_1790 [Dunaliella salina]
MNLIVGLPANAHEPANSAVNPFTYRPVDSLKKINSKANKGCADFPGMLRALCAGHAVALAEAKEGHLDLRLYSDVIHYLNKVWNKSMQCNTRGKAEPGM